ncbi:MAG: TIGR00266 family protein [Planctomycetes bacterium]|nr:TIGR00266 family protein [Planctomycetota bacterium]MCB9871691.1 TIGR00266 family protein [Planctomycetota bacterium]
MEFQILGNPDYGELTLGLAPGETITAESGAMSRMSRHMELRSRIMGGLLSGLGRKLFGGESLFVGEYTAPRGGWLTLAPAVPGQVMHRELGSDDGLILTAGAFLACSPGVQLSTRFGGLRYMFSGKGAFFLRVTGRGDLFYNSYGAVVEREVDGQLTVDTGHIVAWEPALEYSIAGMGGLKQTLFSGEGLVLQFRGRGRVFLQTRTVGETVGWLSPFCIG